MKFAIFFICCLLPLFILLSANNPRKFAVAMKKHLKNNHAKEQGGTDMLAIINQFVGKKCEIQTIESRYRGIIDSIEENWVVVKDSDYNTTEIINLEYVTEIRQCREKKSRKDRKGTEIAETTEENGQSAPAAPQEEKPEI